MNYIIIELQTNNGTTANIVTQYNSLPNAESAFYSICASAVISKVETHSVILADETGFVMKNECFKHTEE